MMMALRSHKSLIRKQYLWNRVAIAEGRMMSEYVVDGKKYRRAKVHAAKWFI